MENTTEQTAVFAALADPTRLRLLNLLSQSREFDALCVNALAEMRGISQSAVSQHLRVLRMAGLVRGERRGYHIHYSINPEAFRRFHETISQMANFNQEESQDDSEEGEMYQGHGEHEGHEGREEDFGCGGRGHHEGGHGFGRQHHSGMGWSGMRHEGCGCPWHRMGMGMGMMGMHAGMGMGFGFRRFISQDEIISRLEEYLKELQAEAKAVEEHIAEIKKRGKGKEQS